MTCDQMYQVCTAGCPRSCGEVPNSWWGSKKQNEETGILEMIKLGLEG